MVTSSLTAILPREMAELRSRPLFIFQLEVQKPSVVGATPWCDRRVGEITGGRFEGERLRGKLLPGGSDWQTVRTDGAWTLDVRVVMETDDGHLIGMTYRGLRHGPKEVLDRIARGEVGAPPSIICAPRRSSRLRPSAMAGSTASSRWRRGIDCRPGRSIRCSKSSDAGPARAVGPCSRQP